VRVLVSAGAVLCVLATAVGIEAPARAAAEVERFVIGESADGRAIVALHRPGAKVVDADEHDTRRRNTVLVVGSMHGDEKAGRAVVARLRDAPVPAGTDLWLVSTLNPDGNQADRRTNARGVDLNRNFPRRWRPAGGGTTTYSGPSPASEPETQALMDFVRAHDVRTTVVLHQPLFGVDSYRAKSPRLVRDLARRSGLPLAAFDCSGGCHGTFTDWANDRTPGRAVTVELGRSPTRSRLDRVATAVLRATR